MDFAKTTRGMGHAVMLPFVFRMCSDAAKFWALEMFREATTAKWKYWEQQSVCKRKLIKAKLSCKIKKTGFSMCIGNKQKAHTPTGDMQWDKCIYLS